MPALIRYPSRTSASQPPHHLTTYRLATLLTIVFGATVLLFWVLTLGTPSLVIAYDWLPISYLAILAISFFVPFRNLSRTGRYRFLAILKRISIGGIATNTNGKFGDILLADVLTSYSKPIADLFVSLCMFLSPGRSATARPDRGIGGQFLVPLIIAAPYAIRFRQCVIEYRRVQRKNARQGYVGASGWGGQHLANAVKYATAFPVITLSALQRALSFDHTSLGLSEAGLYRLWLLAVVINSFYSFYWDVAKDWDLTLFASSRERNANDHPWGLRRIRVFRPKEVYYAAIVVDFLLRCTWSLKLSPHLDHFNDLEGGIFAIQLAEVFRRWMWIYLRVETEWVRNLSNGNAGLGGPGPDDVLLGDFQVKDDDD